MKTRRVRLVLIGLGNVGRNLLTLLVEKKDILAANYGLELVVVGAADSAGAAVDANGIDLPAAISLKQQKKSISTLPRSGKPGLSAWNLVRQVQADMLVEMSLTNLEHGQPGLQCMREAMSRGWDVVTANKGPLVLAFPELMGLAKSKERQIRFSATVGGGLPSVNVGRRDLVACTIDRFEGILNGTTHVILTAMEEEGKTFAQALAHAQEIGIAEADPTLDVEGWDAANKCVILANSVLGIPATLKDVSVTGIRDVTVEQLRQASQEGKRLKLLVSAVRLAGGGYDLSVRPTAVPLNHPMAHLRGEDMGIVYYTDIMGAITVSIAERGPMPTSAGVLRDVVTIAVG